MFHLCQVASVKLQLYSSYWSCCFIRLILALYYLGAGTMVLCPLLVTDK